MRKEKPTFFFSPILMNLVQINFTQTYKKEKKKELEKPM